MFGKKHKKTYAEPEQALEEYLGDKNMDKNQLRMREKFADLDETENLDTDPSTLRERLDTSTIDDWGAVVDKYQTLVDSGVDSQDAAAETAEFFGTRFDDHGEPIEPFTSWQLLAAIESGGSSPEAGLADELGNFPDSAEGDPLDNPEDYQHDASHTDWTNKDYDAPDEYVIPDWDDPEGNWEYADPERQKEKERSEYGAFQENLREAKRHQSIRKARINSELMQRWGFVKK